MLYHVSIDNGSTVVSGAAIANAEACSDFLVSYLNDEFNENPGSQLNDLFMCFGALYTGLALGGDFSFTFQGEDIFVEVHHESLADLIEAWRHGEHAAASFDPEGSTDEDIKQIADELLQALPAHGDPEGAWHMKVSPGQDEPTGDFTPYDGNTIPLYGKIEENQPTRVQWPCAMGVVTVWQE